MLGWFKDAVRFGLLGGWSRLWIERVDEDSEYQKGGTVVFCIAPKHNDLCILGLGRSHHARFLCTRSLIDVPGEIEATDANEGYP